MPAFRAKLLLAGIDFDPEIGRNMSVIGLDRELEYDRSLPPR